MTFHPKQQGSVSIIIPCYNGRAHLPRLAQNLTALRTEAAELIFVDDGSTDGSVELCRELMPDATILRQTHAGVAAARNTGARDARGDFVQLLDVDDAIQPDKMRAQAAYAVEQGLDVVYSGWQIVVVDGDQVTREPVCDGAMPCEPVAALLAGWWVPPHAYLIRRSAYWEIGGSDSSLVNAQDFDLVLRLAIAGKKFGHQASHLADYYRYLRQSSLARGPRKQYWSDYEKAVAKALHLLREQGALTPEREKAAAKKLHSIARSVYSIDRNWFRRVMQLTLELDPVFEPTGTMIYRMAVKWLGWERAEALAFRTRGVSSMARRIFL